MARFVEFRVDVLPQGAVLAVFNAEHVVTLRRHKDGLEAWIELSNGESYKVLEEYDQAVKKLKG